MQNKNKINLKKIDHLDYEIQVSILPYIKEVLDENEAHRVIWKSRKNIVHSTLKSIIERVKLARTYRTSEWVYDYYESAYTEDPEEFGNQLEESSRVRYYRVGRGGVIKMDSLGLNRAYQCALTMAIKKLAPTSVLELGSGSGRQLLYLATKFPSLELVGCELANSGVTLARKLTKTEHLSAGLLRWLDLEPSDPVNFSNVTFVQGNAAHLHFQPKSFDMLISVLALEQMHTCLDQVLYEIRRVSRRFAIFIEPFKEANDAYGLACLIGRNYFRADISYFERRGFEYIGSVKLPNKLDFGASLVMMKIK